MQEYMIWVWLGVFVVAFIVEAITQDLVSVWFGLGAIVCVCTMVGTINCLCNC